MQFCRTVNVRAYVCTYVFINECMNAGILYVSMEVRIRNMYVSVCMYVCMYLSKMLNN